MLKGYSASLKKIAFSQHFGAPTGWTMEVGNECREGGKETDFEIIDGQPMKLFPGDVSVGHFRLANNLQQTKTMADYLAMHVFVLDMTLADYSAI